MSERSSNSEPLGSSLIELQYVQSSNQSPLLPSNTDDVPTIITQKPPEPQSVAGQRIAHFELIESIGTGGMATVLKARDTELARIVALKLLPTDRDADTITRFKQEARAAAKLDHDNIARVYFCGEDRGQHYIAFEFVAGDNLKQILDKQGVLSPTVALRYLIQIANGFAHAAERGVVHRDIKPSNIIVTSEGKIKIVDMGLARHLESQSVNYGLTQSGTTLGTFDYISPEQALDPRRADTRSDIYSLGCTFYHMLTGRSPVPEGTAAMKLQATQHHAPRDPRELRPGLPDGLAIVLAKMMAKQPERRYQTPTELLHDLQLLAREWQLSELSNSAETTIPEFTTQLAATPPTPLVSTTVLVIGSVVVMIVAVLLGFNSQPQSMPRPSWKPTTSPTVAETGTATTPVPPTAQPTARTLINDARSLAEAIASRAGESITIALRPGVVYDLTSLDDGLLVSAAELVLQPDSADRSSSARPKLRVWATPPTDDGLARPGSLTVRDTTKVALRGLEIEIVERPGGVGMMGEPADDAIGVLLANIDTIEIENCLIRSTAETKKTRLVGVAVTRDARSKATQFTAKHSLFTLGSPAIGLRLPQRADIKLSELGFGPHAEAIALVADPDATADDTKLALQLRSCTFMLDRGSTAIVFPVGLSGKVNLSACVFADAVVDDKLMMPGTDDRPSPSTAIRNDSADSALQFVINANQPPNAYFGVRPIDADTRSIILNSSPWLSEDPRVSLAMAQPWDAFALKIQERRLRWKQEPRILGVKELVVAGTVEKLYRTAWPPAWPALPISAEANQRVVYAEATADDAVNRIYPTFLKAFAELRNGETILLAVNGRVPIPELSERAIRATITAYPGFTPTLVGNDEKPTRPRTSLFSLSDGELSFTNLAVTLSTNVALISLANSASMNLRDCLISLDERDEEQLTVVLLTDVARENATSQIRWENTLIRGRGRGVWMQSPRNLRWTAENVAFVSDDALLCIDAGTRDQTPRPSCELRFKTVSAISSAALFDIHGSAERTTACEVVTERSLFSSLGRRRLPPAFISISNSNTLDEANRFLVWRCEGVNVFGNYETLLEQKFANSTRVTTWDADRWQKMLGEAVRVTPVQLARILTPSRLIQVRPDDLAAEYQMGDASRWRSADCGVDVTKLAKIVDEK